MLYLQYVVELGLQLEVRLGLEDDSFEGLLQHLDASLRLLTGVSDAHVLPLAAQPLLLCFVHLDRTQEQDVDYTNYTLTHVQTQRTSTLPIPQTSSPLTFGTKATVSQALL